MITQQFLDFFSQMIAGIIGLIPPLPGEAQQLVNALEDGIAGFGETAAYMSPIVPYEVFPNILALYGGLLLVWAGYLILRIILWGINR